MLGRKDAFNNGWTICDQSLHFSAQHGLANTHFTLSNEVSFRRPCCVKRGQLLQHVNQMTVRLFRSISADSTIQINLTILLPAIHQDPTDTNGFPQSQIIDLNPIPPFLNIALFILISTPWFSNKIKSKWHTDLCWRSSCCGCSILPIFSIGLSVPVRRRTDQDIKKHISEWISTETYIKTRVLMLAL